MAVAGTLSVDNTSGTTISNLTGAGTVALNQNLKVNNSASRTFSGAFGNGGSGGFELASGTQILSGAVNYGGTTTVDSGTTLKMNGPVTLGGALVDNGTFNVTLANNDITVSNLSGAGTVTLGAKNLTVTAPSSTFSGAINSTGGGLTVGGSGTLTLTGSNGYTGATNINSGGTLSIGTGGDISASSGVTVAGTLSVDNTSGITISNLTGTGTVALNQNLTVNNTGTKTFSGAFGNGGTGGFDLASGNATMSGTVNYGGTTTIASGSTLKYSGPVTLGGALVDNGTFNVSTANNDITVSDLSGNGSVSLGAKNLTVTAPSSTFSGSIGSTGGGLTVGTIGTLTLTGSNSYTGGTTIGAGGTLAIGSGGSIASSSGLANSGTFDISSAGGTVSVKNLTGATSGASITLGANTLQITDTGAAKSYAGAVSGTTGGIELVSGTQDLGNVSYSGLTTVDSGATLRLNGTASLGGVVANGVLSVTGVTGNTVTFDSLTSTDSAGGVIMGGKSIVIANANGVFAGSLAFNNNSNGTVEIVSGTQTFSGTNYYKGGTTIDSGATLYLLANASLQSGVTVNNGATFGGTGTVGNLSFPNSNVVNHGTMSPNDPMTIFGNFTNGTDGVLNIQIGGTDPTQIGGLVVNGTAVLDGTLAVTFTNGFTPLIGESFTILTFTGFSGDFASLTDGGTACSLASVDSWLCDVNGTNYVINEVNNGTSLALTVEAVPEPASIALSLSGIAALAGVRRRRRNRG